MNSYDIILADDHVLMRQGIKEIIHQGESLNVVGEVGDGLALLKLLNKTRPDMIIMDISMPKLRGIEAATEVKSRYPEIKILVLTMHKDPEFLFHAFAAGADGFLLKEDTNTELFSAIRTVRQNRPYVSPYFSKALVDNLVLTCRGGNTFPTDVLTTRERQVLKLIAEGKSNKKMASILNISLFTVQHHRANLIKKLDLDNIADLVKYAIRKGYTTVCV
jgi:DNA-binding NarL/FixJ family response regulator